MNESKEQTRDRYEEEISNLRNEIEEFKKEKERVRTIVGQIGGIPDVRQKIITVIFVLLVILLIPLSLMSEGALRLGMIEVAVILVSVKIIIYMHNQSRVNHLQLWILSGLEWRLNQIRKDMKALKKDSASLRE
jgi:hypothetical protein